jgi:hypothetical protein
MAAPIIQHRGIAAGISVMSDAFNRAGKSANAPRQQ